MRVLALVALVCSLLAACRTVVPAHLEAHTMPIGSSGKLYGKVVPVTPVTGMGDVRVHATRIARGFEASGKKSVLLYLHGGLDSMRSSIEESAVLHPAMEADGYYPIFVNWESGFGKSYRDHLMGTRNGKPRKKVSGAALPFRVVLDAVDIAANSLQAWGASGVDSAHSSVFWHRRNDRVLFEGVPVCNDTPQLVCHDPGEPRRVVGRSVQWLVQSPFKFVFTPVVYTGGEAAWRDMVRRTQVIWDNDDEFWLHQPIKPSPPQGALSVLMQELAEVGANDDPIHITVVAHSMGTIVANELLKRYVTSARVVIDRIIYLAAADDIVHSLGALLPYLRAHPDTHFFNVMLHPFAEDRERSAAGFAPDGSLLVWIDSMFEHPHAFLERTFGRWSNVKPALHLIPDGSGTPEPDDDYRTRMHFHVLGFHDCPETHGAINDPEWAFWRDAFLM